MAERELQFENVLSGASAEKRTALIVFPIVVVLAILVGFAVVAISRMSGLSTQVRMANQQVDEANKVVEERDKQLRDARAEVAVLASPGQGGGVLTAVAKDSGASGVALLHPEQHALNVYAFNLSPPPEGQGYRLVVTDAEGHERVLAAITPDDRGAAYLLARDVPEGATKVQVALVPASAAAQGVKPAAQAGAEESSAPQRQSVLAGDLPRPGEAGVVMPQPQAPKVHARTPAGRGRRRGR
ncbi:MAG TPA: hypothetical protein VF904_16075 [Anaeromyxobacteraceae bacterium]